MSASRLSAAEAVGVARRVLAGEQGVWIVGGAVRDALLGREVLDVDLAVEPGAEERHARAIARACGGAAFPLSEEFGTWRVVAPGGTWHLDVTRLRGDAIEADLRGRDFTINAIAVPLADPEGELVDPTGGRSDLEAGVVRAVSQRSFADDPLRILRAARFASALGFRIESGTVALGRAEASRAGEPAGERQLAELRHLLAGPDPARGIELLDELDALPAALPEIAVLRGVGQNPNHHLDVFGHTLEVLRQAVAVQADLDRFAGQAAEGARELLAEPLADEFTRGMAMRFGALLHDVGKPATRGEHSGYVTFIGHDRVGAQIAGELLRRLKASRALTRYVQGLVRHHLHLGFLVHERPLSKRAIYDYLARCGDVAPDVTLLTVADRLSARGSGSVASPEMIEAHLELVREVMPAALDWHRQGPPRLPLRGDELAAELGIEEGPELGRLIEELRAAVYTGEATTRDEVIALGRRLADGAPEDAE
ncbi:MAG TPA: HDIG domain-containing metalloprotein [Solirubrobacterales bacterium]|jgi:putative nucleotidyltransferase with HDIG domain